MRFDGITAARPSAARLAQSTVIFSEHSTQFDCADGWGLSSHSGE